jgi:hypothetical protein
VIVSAIQPAAVILTHRPSLRFADRSITDR